MPELNSRLKRLFIKLNQFKLFLALSFALVPVLGLAAGDSDRSAFCERLFTSQEFSDLTEKIDKRVLERTALLREGNPFLVDRSGVPVDVLEGINREMAKSILDASLRSVFVTADEIYKKWIRAAAEQIKLEYAEINSKIRKVEATRDSLREAGKLDEAGPVTPHLKLDKNRLPFERPLVAKNYKLAVLLKTYVKGNPGPAEIEKQLMQALIWGQLKNQNNPEKSTPLMLDGVLDLEGTRPEGLRQKYNKLIRKVAEPVIEVANEAFTEPMSKGPVDWNVVLEATKPVFGQLMDELQREFPIDLAFKAGHKDAVEAKRMAAVLLEPEMKRSALSREGVPELVLEPLRGYFESDVGTMLLQSSKGLAPVRNAPLLLLRHGAGTKVSRALSWRTQIPKLVATGTNAVAMSLPGTELAMDFPALVETVGWMELSNRWLARKAAEENGGEAVVMVDVGRSMGSTQSFFHGLLYDRPGNPVKAYVLTSFSNPYTLPEQTARVYDQLKAGSITSVIPEYLDQAGAQGAEGLKILDKVSERAPEFVRTFGGKFLFIQGVSDRDGGPSVIQDQKSFIAKHVPRALLYIIDDPLAKSEYRHLNREKLSDNDMEGQHILMTNGDNMKIEDVRRIFPGVPDHLLPRPEDYPALKDQYLEIMGVFARFYDYLAESTSLRPEEQDSQFAFASLRRKSLGLDAKGNQVRFFDAYIRKLGLTEEQVANAPSGRTVASRMRKIADFFDQAAARDKAFWEAEKNRSAQ